MGCLFFKSSNSTFSSSGRKKRPILEIWATFSKNDHDATFVFALSMFLTKYGVSQTQFVLKLVNFNQLDLGQVSCYDPCVDSKKHLKR